MSNAADAERTITGVAAFAVVALMLPAVAVAVLYPAPSSTAAEALVAHLARYRPVILTALYLSALGWGGMLLVFAAATSVFPRWIAHGALVVAAIHLASAVSWARAGAFGPWGVLPSIAPLSHTAWLAAIATVTLRRGR